MLFCCMAPHVLLLLLWDVMIGTDSQHQDYHIHSTTVRSLSALCCGEQVHLVEIDIEQDPEIAEAAGVSGTPTIQFFKDKQLRLKLPGVKQKKEYREVIESNI